MTKPMTQELVIKLAHAALTRHDLPDIYHERLDFEFSEIEKQGAWLYWLDIINNQRKFGQNPAKLLLPWVLRMLVVEGADKQWRPLNRAEWLMADPIRHRNPDIEGAVLCTAHYREIDKEMKRLGKLPIDIQLDADKPDIDLDCLPEARDELKAYAAQKYQGTNMSADQETYGYVCPVGTWQTFKLRSALVDCYKAHGHADKAEILGLTTSLPDDVDEMPDAGYSICKGKDKTTGAECKTIHNEAECPKCGSPDTKAPTIGKLLKQYSQLAAFKDRMPTVLEHAVGIVGRIRNMGMHAGAIIIADRPLYGNLPLIARRAGDRDVDQHTQWISSWTEGRNTQLSKFGYIKWDILGLKNLKYILTCCELIKQNRGISFGEHLEGWEISDPIRGVAGWYLDREGIQHEISLHDEDAIWLANHSQTDGIFQFDTSLAKQILANGVRNFWDLMLFNAMGHPGPMDSIPEAVTNRDDDTGEWKERLRKLDPIFLEVLETTYGTIVYQEQLATIWQRLGGFTAPEAQDARKAVAKKWKEQLEPIREKWLKGASGRIGLKLAEEWWIKMEDFGRYAFNKSHAVAYCLVAYKCLYLKAHFPAEWWAAVMSDCHPEKLIRYIATAKSERNKDGEAKVKFGPLNINNLTYDFTATDNQINQGLIGVKGIGEKTARQFEGKGQYPHIDDFIAKKGLSRSVMERLIKLGSFEKMAKGHHNRRCLWWWYLYTYVKDLSSKAEDGRTVRQLRELMDAYITRKLGWDEKYILQERRKLIAEYARQYPKRKTVPEKLQFWKPTLSHLSQEEARDLVLNDLVPDYSNVEILDFERRYIGYYLTNCMARYDYDGSCNIAEAKQGGSNIIHGMVTKIEEGQTKNARAAKSTEMDMTKLYLSDGQDECLIFVWNEDMARYRVLLDKIKDRLGKPQRHLPEIGLAAVVRYSRERRSFSLHQQSKYGRDTYVGPTLMELEVIAQCSSPLGMVSPAISVPRPTANTSRTTA